MADAHRKVTLPDGRKGTTLGPADSKGKVEVRVDKSHDVAKVDEKKLK